MMHLSVLRKINCFDGSPVEGGEVVHILVELSVSIFMAAAAPELPAIAAAAPASSV